jgi:hypothetical protein
MTIRLLCTWGIYPIGAIITLDTGTESGLVASKIADTNLSGGTAYVAPVAPNQIFPVGASVNAAGVVANLVANGQAIAVGISATAADIAFSTSVPLTQPGTSYMPQQSVTSVLAFTPAANAVKGALVYLRLLPNGTNVPTFTGFKEWGGSQGYLNVSNVLNTLQFFFDGSDYWYSITQAIGATAEPIPATAISITGPTAGTASVASSVFTIAANGIITGSHVVTPSDSGGGGTFSPTSVTLSSSTASATFTYTPTSTITTRTISATDAGGYTAPTAISFSVTAAAAYARLSQLTAVTESGTGPYSYTSTASGGFLTNGGVLTTALQSGIDGSFGLNTGAIVELIIGVTPNTTMTTYTAMPQALWTGGAGGNWSAFSSGVLQTATNILARQSGDIARLRRVGATLIGEVARSATPTVFTTIYTWASVATTALRFDVNLNSSGTFDTLTATGLA